MKIIIVSGLFLLIIYKYIFFYKVYLFNNLNRPRYENLIFTSVFLTCFL